MRLRTGLLISALLVGSTLTMLVAGAGGHDLQTATGGSAVRVLDTSLKPCGERFAHFHVGASFDGLPLTDHSRVCTVPDPTPSVAAGGAIDPDSLGRSNFDSYVYGTCRAKPGESCAPPLEVQSWPACERSPADYNAGPPGAAEPIEPLETMQLRGVPARLYEDQSLELSTAGVTLVIYGRSRRELLGAARAVRAEEGAPIQVGPTQDLPDPVAGSQTGTLAC